MGNHYFFWKKLSLSFENSWLETELFFLFTLCIIKSSFESLTDKITISGTTNILVVKSCCTSSGKKCINTTAFLTVELKNDSGIRWWLKKIPMCFFWTWWYDLNWGHGNLQRIFKNKMCQGFNIGTIPLKNLTCCLQSLKKLMLKIIP